MAKRRTKKTVKRAESVLETKGIGIDDPKEPQIQKQEAQFVGLELEGMFFTLLAFVFAFVSSKYLIRH